MTRFFIYAVVVVGLGFGIYSWWRGRVQFEERRVAQEQRRRALKSAVLEMASKVNAVVNWEEGLAGDKRIRNSPVLTAELQKQWIIDRPILFLGNLEDVAINQDGSYQVVVNHGLGTRHMFLQNNIRVSLSCPQSVAAPLIQAAKATGTTQITADIAITGVIERIASTTEKDSEGDAITALTGFGRCISAMHVAERLPW